jgi:hypothetical protein
MNQIALTFAFFAAPIALAHASPNVNLSVNGSQIVISASNNEDRTYSCSASYRATYSDGSQVIPVNFGVQPNSSGAVHVNATGWSASSLSASWVNSPTCH